MSDPKNIVLGISVFINIIGCVLLFFKSALNDILKGWWFDRKAKKEQAIQRLINFKTNAYVKHSQDLMAVFYIARMSADIIMGKEKDQTAEKQREDGLRKSTEARNEIAKFLDYLPVNLINKHDRYEEEYLNIIKKIADGKVGKENVMEYLNLLTSLGTETITLADSILRSKFS